MSFVVLQVGAFLPVFCSVTQSESRDVEDWRLCSHELCRSSKSTKVVADEGFWEHKVN